MKVHFRHTLEDSGTRALLLGQSLNALFTKDAGATLIEAAAEDTQSRLFRDLPGFAAGSDRAVFVGLANLPGDMLGRNWLICTRPLSGELADFARRHDLQDRDAAGWVVPLLKNFEAVIFCDIASFNASRGYTPWVPLHVAPNFPVLPECPAPDFSAARIALVLHGGVLPEDGLLGTLRQMGTVQIVAPDTPAGAAQEALTDANMHVHLGYCAQSPVTGLSPFDSAMGRFYTIVLADGPGERAQYGEYLTRVMAMRSYCAIAHSPGHAADLAEAMIDRFTVMARNRFRINPELSSYGRENDRQINKSLRRFRRLIEND